MQTDQQSCPCPSPVAPMPADRVRECEAGGKQGSAVSADTAATAVINEEVCPYFKRDRGGGRVICEGASFKFPDKLSRREYLYRFCAHPEGYKSCPLKVALDHYYERKYDYHA